MRASARGLGIAWPAGRDYAQVIRSLDPGDPQHAAFLDNVTTLLRGAGYTAFDGATPELSEHSAIVGPYAHVTAPLRRLVDRFGLAVCLALTEGRSVADDVRRALPELPGLMAASGRRAKAVDRGCLDYLEAELLCGREGVAFRGSRHRAAQGRRDRAAGRPGDHGPLPRDGPARRRVGRRLARGG